MRRTLALLLCLALPGTVAAQDGNGEENGDEHRKPRPAKWNVEDPGGPYRDFSLTTGEGTWMSVDVHPDGKRLVFDLLGDLYELPMEGGEAKPLTSGLAWDIQPRWSPDGKTLLFTSDRGGGDNLWLADADGTNPRALTKETFRLYNNGTWHHTGQWVVGRKHFTSRRSLGAGEMWMIRVPSGGKGVQLTKRKNDQQDAGEPIFSPDGRYLYWSEDMSGGKTFEYNKDPNGIIYVIRRLDMETGEIRDVVRRNGGAVRPQPSPDGKSLAFVRRRRAKSVLALLDLETGSVRDLWDGLSKDQQETWAIFGPYPGYSWTPDGKSLVIWAQGGLHRVDAATGKPTAIPFTVKVDRKLLPTARIEHSVGGETFDVKVIRWPQVAPDGTKVFQALGHLWTRKPGADGPERLTTRTDAFEFAPRLTRDGKSVVYTTWHDTRGGFVHRIGLDGSGDEVLVGRPGHYVSADLSSDSMDLVVHRGGGDTYRGSRFGGDTGIWRYRLDGKSEPRLLTRSGTKPRFSADGLRIFLQGREGKDHALISVDRIGSDRRVHAVSSHAMDFVPSPDGKWLAWEELWQTYVVPMSPGPAPLRVAPKMRDVPVKRLSEVAGTYLSWAVDSSAVRWSLGPRLSSMKVGALSAMTRDKKGEWTHAPVVQDAWTLGW
ncbi:MAG: TolB family protein, partial [Planctomycetota bacterium]